MKADYRLNDHGTLVEAWPGFRLLLCRFGLRQIYQDPIAEHIDPELIRLICKCSLIRHFDYRLPFKKTSSASTLGDVLLGMDL